MSEQETGKLALVELIAAADSLGAEGGKVDHIIKDAFLLATGSAEMHGGNAQKVLSSVTEPQAHRIVQACARTASEYDADLAGRPLNLKAMMIASIALVDDQTGSSNPHLLKAFHHIYDNAGPPISVTYEPIARL